LLHLAAVHSLGGAIANLLDRIVYGYVVDFIDVG
jgi:lipoprotein signal peptidase